jgi:2-keto-3-deoxy-L-rhamnonate aldolase RhmA
MCTIFDRYPQHASANRKKQPCVSSCYDTRSPNPWTAELIADGGFDAVTIDMQHGLVDYGAAVPMLQAVSVPTCFRQCGCRGTSRPSA